MSEQPKKCVCGDDRDCAEGKAFLYRMVAKYEALLKSIEPSSSPYGQVATIDSKVLTKEEIQKKIQHWKGIIEEFEKDHHVKN